MEGQCHQGITTQKGTDFITRNISFFKLYQQPDYDMEITEGTHTECEGEEEEDNARDQYDDVAMSHHLSQEEAESQPQLMVRPEQSRSDRHGGTTCEEREMAEEGPRVKEECYVAVRLTHIAIHRKGVFVVYPGTSRHDGNVRDVSGAANKRPGDRNPGIKKGNYMSKCICDAQCSITLHAASQNCVLQWDVCQVLCS
ncbi:hypothetical protein NDU88_001955 [Pleurodeles waltl]|uniref:Uncharacterized protein n=1 Tax=Pleurodeles waltl TaxID=8319 RepID=A0AAV7T0Q3_PLEWA|nr:hypothetical protein NDU88_001955 [Pleurodeles waltl]